MTRTAPVLHSIVAVVGVIAVFACSRREPAPAPDAAPAATPTAVRGGVATAPAVASSVPQAPAPGGPPAIATADGEKAGVRAEVTEFKRSSGGTVNLKFAMINDSAERVSFGYDYADKDHDITDVGSIGGVHLIDPVGKKKYFVARDADNKCLCSQKIADIQPGGRVNLWAKFPAPPDGVEQLSIVIPHFSPLDDVPLGS